MQKIATGIFIGSSIVFGILGISMVLTAPDGNEGSNEVNTLLQKLLFITVFFILPSFAVSVAGKYLTSKSQHVSK